MNSSKVKLAILILLMVGGLLAVKIIGYPTIKLWTEIFIQQVHGLGWLGMVLYALVIALACLVALPVMPLTVGAGIIFKFWIGCGIAMFGLVMGAAAGFIVARHLAREFVVEKLKNSPKFKAIDTAVGNEGGKIVVLLRMCPLPFGLASYIYGITSIPFWHYLFATLAGIVPGTAFFVYLGHAGKAGLDSKVSQNSAMIAPLAIGLIAGVVCLFFVGKIARQAVAKATRDTPTEPPVLEEVIK